MINLSLVAKELNKPGSKVDMIAQEAIINSVKIARGKIVIRVTPLRNLHKNYPPDQYVWGQDEAQLYQINKWKILEEN